MENKLPDTLVYLQEFLDLLYEIPSEELHAEIDPFVLESALRKRIGTVDFKKARKFLDNDRKILKQWLENSEDLAHPAYWILGFLSIPGLAKKIFNIASSEEKDPTIKLDSPVGWDLTEAPLQLNGQKGNLTACVTIIDGGSFEHLQIQFGQGYGDNSEIQLGETVGRKYVHCQTHPIYWKRVEYVVEVPGGFCSISLQDSSGKNFDEVPFELQLDTLKIIKG